MTGHCESQALYWQSPGGEKSEAGAAGRRGHVGCMRAGGHPEREDKGWRKNDQETE